MKSNFFSNYGAQCMQNVTTSHNFLEYLIYMWRNKVTITIIAEKERRALTTYNEINMINFYYQNENLGKNQTQLVAYT